MSMKTSLSVTKMRNFCLLPLFMEQMRRERAIFLERFQRLLRPFAIRMTGKLIGLSVESFLLQWILKPLSNRLLSILYSLQKVKNTNMVFQLQIGPLLMNTFMNFALLVLLRYLNAVNPISTALPRRMKMSLTPMFLKIHRINYSFLQPLVGIAN